MKKNNLFQYILDNRCIVNVQLHFCQVIKALKVRFIRTEIAVSLIFF
jgi:hypothetical protein